ncbi:MAG TPA: TIGR02757 family protein [Puia sp.]|nr:TIGR02757 family protein [Puia sp.]
MKLSVKKGKDREGELRAFLDQKVAEYNRPSFIPDDPISIPHQYNRRQDIEIAGFFAAIFSWGNRKTIIRKTEELMQLMDRAPYEFVLQHTDNDLKKLLEFRHRTFNATDLLYFVTFFHHHYSHYDSLEDAFLRPWEQREPAPDGWDAERALSAFYHYFFSLDDTPPRTRKHIASPEKNSSCKRINMFLRWMVRRDANGVDFGLWRRIGPERLICPLDVHVARVAKRFQLLTRKPTDWLSARELTERLLAFDPADPVKYDFALFGLGAMEKF